MFRSINELTPNEAVLFEISKFGLNIQDIINVSIFKQILFEI